MKLRKKIIEVAMPLEIINAACANEKNNPFLKNHPRSIHTWWARRPFLGARAMIFSQIIDDPGDCVELFPTIKEQNEERQRLFGIIEQLVLWENNNNKDVLEKAKKEIWNSWRRACADNFDHPQAKELFDPEKLPAFHDPFAGGGALPLEAQRLGLESHASDLNPVAVLINKAMIEIPPRFAGRPPVNPEVQKNVYLFGREWKGAQGLAEDVRYYGNWMREEAQKRIGHLYPKVLVTEDMAQEREDLKPYVGQELTVIAWIWARTVKSPNPAFAHVDVPLASTFILSTKAGKEAYVEPIVDKDGYSFKVRVGKPNSNKNYESGTSAGKRSGFKCIMSNTPLTYNYIREQGSSQEMGSKLMAIVVEGNRGRVYISPTGRQEQIANKAKPTWRPDTSLHGKSRVNVSNYGIDVYGDLFTSRQLVALNTFSDLVGEARQKIKKDALEAGMSDDEIPIRDGGIGALSYAEAVGVYLGLATSRWSDFSNTICSWNQTNQNIRVLFSRHAIPMTWDFSEINPFGSVGPWISALNSIVNAIPNLAPNNRGYAFQLDASSQSLSDLKIVSTDPPYYDNIGYADLSDFFYLWQRRCLKDIWPELYETIAVPKMQELIATPYRHESKEAADIFFLNGMKKAMQNIFKYSHPVFPITIYYAFKQSETNDDNETTNTGWETFLNAVIDSGFSITGTWPIRSEKEGRSISNGTNALASSIVIVCRKRLDELPSTTRREFVSSLKAEMPEALRHMQECNIAPVDLAQASIGPGMAIYTRYGKVLDTEGKALSVREALALINQVLDETLSEQDADFDSDTRFALAWYEEHGLEEGAYGEALTLARAKNTSVDGLSEAGILVSSRGRVRLLKPEEMPDDWNPESDDRLTVWESLHHLTKRLQSGGESAAASLAVLLGSHADTARELAYRLYSICERKKRPQEALAYNALVQSWPEIKRLTNVTSSPSIQQKGIFE